MLVLDARVSGELAERPPKEARRLGHGVCHHLVLDSQHPPLRVEHQRLRAIRVDGTSKQCFVGSVKAHRTLLWGLTEGCRIEAELVSHVPFPRRPKQWRSACCYQLHQRYQRHLSYQSYQPAGGDRGRADRQCL